MKQKCQACGGEKDASQKEVYPWPEEDLIEEPIAPFMAIDCQGPDVGGTTDWRLANVCHHCFHKLDVAMWISKGGWESLNPATPFEQLPKLGAKK